MHMCDIQIDKINLLTTFYNFAANLALTKLCQFFPHLADESCTALVLLLALLECPSTDFMVLSYLVPERVQEREPCTTLKRCSDLLEQSQFGTFWVTFRELVINDSASEELKMATASPAAVAKIRTNILDLLTVIRQKNSWLFLRRYLPYSDCLRHWVCRERDS